MRLTRLTVLVILAAFIAFEPVVHTHPLLPAPDAGGITNPNLCAICAVGADRAIFGIPTVVAPAAVIEPLFTADVLPLSTDVRVPSASRAPPAA